MAAHTPNLTFTLLQTKSGFLVAGELCSDLSFVSTANSNWISLLDILMISKAKKINTYMLFAFRFSCTQTCASISELLDKGWCADTHYGLLHALLRSFSACWVNRVLRTVHSRCMTWWSACSDVEPSKPQSNNKQMEHVETAAKICSSLNRISCCLFLEKWNHIMLR